MATVELLFNGATTTIQCKENDTIKEILDKFCVKVGQNIKDLCFLYGGKIIELNKTFYEVASVEDKKRKIMSIIVTDNETAKNENSHLKKSKYRKRRVKSPPKKIHSKYQKYYISILSS